MLFEKYKSEIIKNETGLIRINFVVNCKGKTDRFRLISMNENYEEKVFVPSITEQLMSITKNLKGWKEKKYKGVDYYQYLIFNLEIQWKTCLSLHITQRILILMRNRNTICT